MSYFTTMNLPAPPGARFHELLKDYWGRPQDALMEFEKQLASFFDVPKVSTWTNCFTAMALALLHATRGRSKKVAISGLAYRRTVDIVEWAGLQPVLVDNSPMTLAMDVQALQQTLAQDDIGAILMQHPMVHIADVAAFTEVAQAFGVPIMFDSVEATGGCYQGRKIGRFGLAEAFSLHPSKVINAAEGGVLTFGAASNHALFQESMKQLGVLCPKTGAPHLFGLEPVHAIMGLASLEIYDEVTARHERQYLRYQNGLSGLSGLELVAYDKDARPNYKSILVHVKSGSGHHRQQLLEHLEFLGIGARSYYAPLHRRTAGYSLPQAQRLSEQYFILPIGTSVNFDAIDTICAAIRDFEQGGG